MILLVVYPCAIWLLAHAYRRRWLSFVVALGSVVPVVLAVLAAQHFLARGAQGLFPTVWLAPGLYAAVVCGVGLLIASQPRRRAGACAKCAYDLAGNQSGVCPECGAPIPQGQAVSAPERARSAA